MSDLTVEKTNTYDRLIVSLEAGLGTLQILLAVCDNTALRQQTMRQYEEELEAQGVRVYRLSINPQEPSLLQALIDGKIENASQAIATVTGAEKISNLGDRQTLKSFLGYLQWTREALRRYPMPIVLWLPSALLPEVANLAPDFWSWRGGTFTFKSAFSTPVSTDPIYITKLSEDSSKRSSGSVLSVLQLEESLAEAIKTWGEESANTEPIYYQLGRAYSERVWKGEAIDREKEQLFAETYLNRAITLQKRYKRQYDLSYSLNSLGYMYKNLGYWDKAETIYKESLQVSEEIGDRRIVANTFGQLGDIERNRGNWDASEALYRQYLQVSEEIGDRAGMASSWGVLGDIERNRVNWDAAEALYTQSLQVREEIGDRVGMATSVGCLGETALGRGNLDEAEKLLQQALNEMDALGMTWSIGETNWDLALLEKQRGNLSLAQQYYEKAKSIYQQLGAKKKLEGIEQEWLA